MHFVAVDRLAVECFANRLLVVLQALVGEEAARLLGSCGAPAQGTSSFCDIRQKLIDLERIRLLLLELVIKRGILRLLCLLFERPGAQLCLRTLQSCRLCSRAKSCERIGGIRPFTICGLP